MLAVAVAAAVDTRGTGCTVVAVQAVTAVTATAMAMATTVAAIIAGLIATTALVT